MEKKKYLLTGLFFAILFFMASPAQKAYAQGIQNLYPNRSYQSYDVTGDNKKDTFLVRTEGDRDWYTKATVMVNGRKAYEVKQGAEGYTIQLLTLKNKKPFLFLYADAYNMDGHCKVLQYQKGKFVPVFNEEGLFGVYGLHSGARVKRVSGNKVTMTCSLMSWTLSLVDFDLVYEYKGGTLRRADYKVNMKALSPNVMSKGYYTAKKSVVTYNKAGSKASKAFTIRPGSKVVIKKIWVKGGKVWFRATVNGKNGWFPGARKAYPYNQEPFDVMYAG